MIEYHAENFGKRYEYRTNSHRDWNVVPHIHEFSEIAFTKSGVTTVLIEDRKYLLPPGHLIFVLPNQIHEYRGETSSYMRCAVFSNDFVPAFFEKVGEMRLQDPVVDLTGEPYLLEQLDTVDPAQTVKLCGILNLVCDRVLSATGLVPAAVGRPSMFYEVISYISRNFTEDIRLQDLAKKLGYHEKYLSGALHSLTGMNFRAFLASYRINYAKQLLRARTGPTPAIAEIALRCGFSSINSFNRAFRAIAGVTPTQYARR